MNWLFAHMPQDIAAQQEVALGALNATTSLAAALRRLGHNTRLLAWSSLDVSEFHGMELRRVEGADEKNWHKALYDEPPADVLVGLSRVDVFQGKPRWKQICWNHNPCILHGVPEHGRALYWLTQAVVCPSEASRRRQREWGAPGALLKVIPNGIDTQLFRVTKPAGENTRRTRLAFVGSCTYWKGLDVVLQAYALALRRCPQLTLDLYGDSQPWPVKQVPAPAGIKLDGDDMPDWPAIEAAYPGLSYHGKVAPPVLAEALRKTGFLLCASRDEETFSLAVLEAQACGCIPIAPERAAYPERIRCGHTGFLYAPDKAEVLAEKIVRVLESGTELPVLRADAASHAASSNWGKAADAFAGMVEELPQLGMGRRYCYRAHRNFKSLLSKLGLSGGSHRA